MNPTHKKMVAELYKAYRAIDDNFLKLLAQCETDAQRTDIRAIHKAASDAYWKAEAETLVDNSSFVLALRTEIVADTASFKNSVRRLGAIARSIEIATRIARAAASIVTLAAI